jgi:hexosaminidase
MVWYPFLTCSAAPQCCLTLAGLRLFAQVTAAESLGNTTPRDRLCRESSSALLRHPFQAGVPTSKGVVNFMKRYRTALICIGFLLATELLSKPAPTALFLRGYSVLPAPQKVHLTEGDTRLDASWGYDTGRLSPQHIALRSLQRDLKEFYAMELPKAGTPSTNKLILRVQAGTVTTGLPRGVEPQAYRLVIAPHQIEITGNSDQGLFYGTATLLQLLKPDSQGRLQLPLCEIEDWPAYQLRFLHWDTKHHQDRMETIKRYLDWTARFKGNMIGFELEDKFEYPSHPVIGAPGAFTPAQLQEIVNYGLERFIQVVPQIQSPAHMAYVLKHPEFADLRSDGSNYQICTCDPRSYDLIFSMYADLLKATQGIDYFFVSTDEYYYPGICSKCGLPFTAENRSLQWAEFANRAHDFLAPKNRRMLAWVEYPFLTRHTPLLPKDLIDGVMGSDPEEIQNELRHGMDHLVYVSLQGEELLFPNHFGNSTSKDYVAGRLEDVYQEIAVRAEIGKPLGVYGAAWDDSGLHSETFWLGWATVAQQGWSPALAPVEQTVTDFMNIYYGSPASELAGIYQQLQHQARFFDASWDRVISRVRGPAYGNHQAKGIGNLRYDRTLPPPALPSLPGLDLIPSYATSYLARMDKAAQCLMENDQLTRSLMQKILEVPRNRYNLEVFLSLAMLTGHQERLLLGLQAIETHLQQARSWVLAANPQRALGELAQGYRRAEALVTERKDTFERLRRIWEKSQFPKGREVGGRQFVHILDDVKDHFADRRPDLSYMIAPEESIGLEAWMQKLDQIGKSFMERHKIPVVSLQDFRYELD